MRMFDFCMAVYAYGCVSHRVEAVCAPDALMVCACCAMISFIMSCGAATSLTACAQMVGYFL